MDALTLNRENILRLVNKFHQTGTVNNLPHHRMHTALTPETLGMVLSALSAIPNKSLQIVAKEQNVSYSTVHHATRALQFLHTIFELHTNSHRLIPINVYITVTGFLRILHLCQCNQPYWMIFYFQWNVVLAVWVRKQSK